MSFFINFIIIPWLTALLAASAAAPLGALISWRRLVFFGEALAHASWLGIAIAISLKIPIYIGIWMISALVILLLTVLKRQTHTDDNNLLGTLSHILLAIGVIVISKMSNVRTDLFAYLFGDILNATIADLTLTAIAALTVFIILRLLWQPLILLTINPDIAQTEIPNIRHYEMVFLLLLGAFTGIMMQLLGLMLIMAFLIIPVQTANRFAKTPEQCVILAAICAGTSATGGIGLSYLLNAPTAPAIAALSGILYLSSETYALIYQKKNL